MEPIDLPSFAEAGDGGTTELTASCVDTDGGACAAYRFDLTPSAGGLVRYSITVTADGFEPATITGELITATGCFELPDVVRTVQLTPLP